MLTSISNLYLQEMVHQQPCAKTQTSSPETNKNVTPTVIFSGRLIIPAINSAKLLGAKTVVQHYPQDISFSYHDLQFFQNASMLLISA